MKLTEAHLALIKILAAVAVDEFVADREKEKEDKEGKDTDGSTH